MGSMFDNDMAMVFSTDSEIHSVMDLMDAAISFRLNSALEEAHKAINIGANEDDMPSQAWMEMVLPHERELASYRVQAAYWMGVASGCKQVGSTMEMVRRLANEDGTLRSQDPLGLVRIIMEEMTADMGKNMNEEERAELHEKMEVAYAEVLQLAKLQQIKRTLENIVAATAKREAEEQGEEL